MGSQPRARRAILLALGPEKHFAIRRAMDDPSGPDLPATILQHHSNATYVMDRGAYFGTPISDAVKPSRTATVTMNERV
jgi:hypothetical protein